MAYQIGDFITFNYRGRQSTDPTPRVLVLHPNWQGLMHGLNFNYLTSQEQNYIKAVINPIFEAEIVKHDQRIAVQMQRIQATLNNLHITSPHEFYIRFVRGFIQPRNWDPYRLYKSEGMSGGRVLTPQRVMIGDEREGVFKRFAQKFQNMRGPQAPALTRPYHMSRTPPPLGNVEPVSPVPTLGKGGAKKLSDL